MLAHAVCQLCAEDVATVAPHASGDYALGAQLCYMLPQLEPELDATRSSITESCIHTFTCPCAADNLCRTRERDRNRDRDCSRDRSRSRSSHICIYSLCRICFSSLLAQGRERERDRDRDRDSSRGRSRSSSPHICFPPPCCICLHSLCARSVSVRGIVTGTVLHHASVTLSIQQICSCRSPVCCRERERERDRDRDRSRGRSRSRSPRI
jgi:hypothetical protein